MEFKMIRKPFKNSIEFEIISKPFSWNDNFSEIALEDFSLIQKDLPYCTCQSIGMALAKLELLEKQGCKVKSDKKEILQRILRKIKKYLGVQSPSKLLMGNDPYEK